MVVHSVDRLARNLDDLRALVQADPKGRTGWSSSTLVSPQQEGTPPAGRHHPSPTARRVYGAEDDTHARTGSRAGQARRHRHS